MKLLGLITLILILIGLAIVGPIFTIWSVNFLFGTALAVNLSTWASLVWLQFIGTSLFCAPLVTKKIKIVD